MMTTKLSAFLRGLVSALMFAAATSEERCERLKEVLMYTQEKAPRDLSQLVSSIPGRYLPVMERQVASEDL